MGGAGRASPAKTTAAPAVADPAAAPHAAGTSLAERVARLQAAVAPWARTVTEAEVLALLTYTGTGHTAINARLRARRGLPLATVDAGDPPSPVARAALVSTVRRLDALIGRSRLPETITVYRGRARQVPLAEAEQRIGGVATDHGFVSTSLAPAVAARHAGAPPPGPGADPGTVALYGGTLYEITIPAGSPGAWVDVHEDRAEYEVLLARGSRFRVTGVRQEPGAGDPAAATTVIQMTLLPPRSPPHE